MVGVISAVVVVVVADTSWCHCVVPGPRLGTTPHYCIAGQATLGRVIVAE